jgi:hypothetical protein
VLLYILFYVLHYILLYHEIHLVTSPVKLHFSFILFILFI